MARLLRLVEVRRVTRRFPTGEVKKTEPTGEERWISADIQKRHDFDGDSDLVWAPLSTAREEQLLASGQPTMKREVL